MKRWRINSVCQWKQTTFLKLRASTNLKMLQPTAEIRIYAACQWSLTYHYIGPSLCDFKPVAMLYWPSSKQRIRAAIAQLYDKLSYRIISNCIVIKQTPVMNITGSQRTDHGRNTNLRVRVVWHQLQCVWQMWQKTTAKNLEQRQTHDWHGNSVKCRRQQRFGCQLLRSRCSCWGRLV